MKNKFWYLIVILISFSSCHKDYEENDFADESNFPIDEPSTENPNQTNSEEGQLTLYQILGTDLSKIKDYNVSSDLKSFQQDYSKHFEMWNFVTRLLPENQRGRLEQFEVFHGGGDLLGYVEPIEEGDLSRWKFALAIDAANQLEEINLKELFTYVSIHEYGHVYTLNETQISSGQNNCNTFNPDEGCATSNSFINKLYEIGWKDIYSEFENLYEDEYEGFYEKYKSRFVSDYAATNPGEDVAEVFAFFIIEPEIPSGNSIADQKIKMMYQNPDLVELRNNIRAAETFTGSNSESFRASNIRSKFKFKCKHQHKKFSKTN